MKETQTHNTQQQCELQVFHSAQSLGVKWKRPTVIYSCVYTKERPCIVKPRSHWHQQSSGNSLIFNESVISTDKNDRIQRQHNVVKFVWERFMQISVLYIYIYTSQCEGGLRERDRRRQWDRQTDEERETLFNPEVLNEINQPTARVLLQIW